MQFCTKNKIKKIKRMKEIYNNLFLILTLMEKKKRKVVVIVLCVGIEPSQNAKVWNATLDKFTCFPRHNTCIFFVYSFL